MMASGRLLVIALCIGEVASFGHNFRGSRLGRNGVRRSVTLSPMAQNVQKFNAKDPSAFTTAILGDLHLDPRYMDDVYEGREHFKKILSVAKAEDIPVAVCSLGDLGESKVIFLTNNSSLSLFSRWCRKGSPFSKNQSGRTPP